MRVSFNLLLVLTVSFIKAILLRPSTLVGDWFGVRVNEVADAVRAASNLRLILFPNT